MLRLWIAAAMAMILMGCGENTTNYNFLQSMTPHDAEVQPAEWVGARGADGQPDINGDGFISPLDDLNGDGRIGKLDEMLASDGVYIEPEQTADKLPTAEVSGGETGKHNENQVLTALNIFQSIRDLEGSELLLKIWFSEAQLETKLEKFFLSPSSPARTQLLEALNSHGVYFLEMAVQLGMVNLDGK